MFGDDVARHGEPSLEDLLSKTISMSNSAIATTTTLEDTPEHHQQELGEAGESFHGQEDLDNLASSKQLWSNGG